MTDTSVDDDIAKSKAGDAVAFGRVMLATQHNAFQLAFRLLCNEDDAKDVVQESFIRAWNNLGRFDVQRKFTTWLFRIVSNACLDHLRARRRRSDRFVPENAADGGSQTTGDDSATDRASNADLARLIAGLTHRLPPRQRLVFTLRDLQDLSVEEVAEVTGLSPDTIKANLYHARRTIRKYLESVYDVTGA